MIRGNGGRPYENQIRNLYRTYQEKDRELAHAIMEAKRIRSSKLDILMGKRVMVRTVLMDLHKTMKTCGYLDQDEIISRRLKNPRLT